jgi:hypothetical protein
MNMAKRILLFLLFLLIGARVGSESGQATATPHSLRILHINVWSGLDYKGHLKMGEYESEADREKRFLALCRQIRQLKPDVIGINEANKLPDYAERLARETGLEVFYHVGVGGVRLGPVGLPWNLREGDAVLAQKDLNPRLVGRKQLSGGYVGNWATFHFSDATQIVAIQLTVTNMPIFIFVTHWHSSLPDAPYVLSKAAELKESGTITGDEYRDVLARIGEGVAVRMSEARMTADFIRETAGSYPCVLMGDLNAEVGSQEINALLQFGMLDTYRSANADSSGFTWDPRTNLNYRTYYAKQSPSEIGSDACARIAYLTREIPKRIDYIFLGPSTVPTSGAISIVSSSVALTETVDSVQASDHGEGDYCLAAKLRSRNVNAFIDTVERRGVAPRTQPVNRVV